MSDNTPKWLVEIGRRGQQRVTGRPVPPMPPDLQHAKVKSVDPVESVTLEKDFRSLIDECGEEQEYELNGRILDAMSENRLTSKQAVRLLRALFKKIDGGPGCQLVDSAGEPHDLDRWGAA